MTLDEFIAKLQEIRAAYGSELLVLHHDDWNEFLVDEIEFNDGQWSHKLDTTNDPEPPHIVLTGDSIAFDHYDNSYAGLIDYRDPK